MKTIALASLATRQPIMFYLSVMNYKYKKGLKHRNRSKFYYDAHWGFKRSFKVDYIQSNEFKKALKNRILEE